MTVIIDLTSIHEKTRPARWLDMLEVRAQRMACRSAASVVGKGGDGAMDGFTGFKTATAQELPDAVPVMDPSHVVPLTGEGLDRRRQRVPQDTTGHRGRAGDPLYKVRRTLHTSADLLTDKQHTRLEAVFRPEEHLGVEATWGIYQRIVAAYRHPDQKKEIGAHASRY